MKRSWLVIALALTFIGVLWLLASGKVDVTPVQTAIGLKPASVQRSKAKPICSSPVNPNVAVPTDCIPQYLANLPPDPGPEGMKTLEGIDSDRDGVRDDVQRFIAESWPQSERARRALTARAKSVQAQVIMGDSVSREEAEAFVQKVGAKESGCYIGSVDPAIISSRAAESVGIKVTNTPERYAQVKKFSRLLHGSGFTLDTSPLAEQCGYDPAQLPN